MKVETSEVSIVVQGAVIPTTKNVLKRLRSLFPDAEIILSTWEKTDVKGLDFDKCVFSHDPGYTVADNVSGTINNVNRQIVSTQNGFLYASRKYALKTRTDIEFFDISFINTWERYCDDARSPLNKRLAICSFYTRSPRASYLCFHPSDWIIFGLTDDVKKYYFAVGLQSSDDSEWYKNHKREVSVYTNYMPRFTPEQHIFLSFLGNKAPAAMNCYYSCDRKLIEMTEKFFAMYFVVLDYDKQLKIKFIKYNPNRFKEKNSLMTHNQWRIIYKHYICGSIFPSWCLYLAHSGIIRLICILRRIIVKALDFIGIKEMIKGFLNFRIGGQK